MKRRRIQPRDYTVGWICALPIELAAAQEMLDEEHEGFPQRGPDPNLYTLGRIGDHNVVLACLPAGQTGTQSAATVAAQMRSAFPSMRFGLMVGIGGGVPSTDADIRLGDVVVSQPHQQHGGVVQYDFGKTGLDGHKTRTGWLNAPPAELLNAVSNLQALHHRGRGNLATHLSTFDRLPKFSHDTAGPDVLFEATYNHVGGSTCEYCSRDREVKRTSRKSQDVVIHYGTIASGNQVMKDGVTRDRLSAELGGVICFEMEAAGLMNTFPCLVIRGICDYADSHKCKRWQPFAAATAAACAKEMLSIIPVAENIKIHIKESTEEYGRLMHLITVQSHEIAKLRQENQSLQEQNNELQRNTYMTIQQHEANLLKYRLQLFQRELPSQILWQKPVVLNDSRGRSYPFFLESISSAELFVELLKHKFKDLGLNKVKRGEWLLEDHYNRRIINLTQPWGAIIRPGQMLDMSMIFRKRNIPSTHCPTCHSENNGTSETEIKCSTCGLVYRRIEEIQEIGVEKDSETASQSTAYQTPRRRESLPVPSPRPRPPKSQNDDDDISDYTRVRVINTRFRVQEINEGNMGAVRATVHLRDLKDTEWLSEYLATTCSISKEDCLAALKECDAQLLAVIAGLEQPRAYQNIAQRREDSSSGQRSFAPPHGLSIVELLRMYGGPPAPTLPIVASEPSC